MVGTLAVGTRRCFFVLPVVVALLAAGGGAVQAQESLSIRATKPSVLGFSYGWDSGITVDGGTVRMTEPPKVKAVREGTAAAAAGLRTGDVILSVNGRDAREPAVLRDIGPAEKVALVVLRSGEQHRLQFVTQKPPLQ